MINTTELRKLAAEATPGPWEAHVERYGTEVGDYYGAYIPGVAEEISTEFDGEQAPLTPEDAEFIAAAREALPSLLDALDTSEAIRAHEGTMRDDAEHRATRAEAQSEARRLAAEYWRNSAHEANQERYDWRQIALEERAGALDLLEQIKARDARIQAVRGLLDEPDTMVGRDLYISVDRLRPALDGDT